MLCKFYNKWFWQCQPRGYVPLPEPAATFDGATCSGKVQQVGCCTSEVLTIICWRLMMHGAVASPPERQALPHIALP